MSLSYPTYDGNGNIQAINDALDPTKNRTFNYDALDRLDDATSAGIWGGTLDWTYDGVGNRLSENSTTYTYYSGTNRLSGAGGTSFSYDNNGNTTTETSRSYTYNQNQRLIQANNGSTTAYYTYNGNGQRVKKDANGTVTIFHYSLSGQIIAESDNAGTVTAEYVYLNGQPLAKIEGANTYYYHNDHLYTPQKMTDSAGSVVWVADYKPFGEVNITTSDITNNLRFSGQYYDAETGLHYNYMRDYNAVIGRYIETDPFGLRGGVNLYIYVKDNPIIKIDPRGLTSNAVYYCDPMEGCVQVGGDPLPPDTPYTDPYSPTIPTYCNTYSRSISACADAAAIGAVAATALSGGVSTPVTGTVAVTAGAVSITNGVFHIALCGPGISDATSIIGPFIPGWWGAAVSALDMAFNAAGL